ncbi:hypothetical protein LSH36_11g10000 [Paralvinella palmiformis]|uniref:Uncharacterized protein n=1 Tax=Paralvinella palmiformis TaxID=53620 RepID=A0AAD9KDT2_9ANNE|nr:hypothetical protein LSH36_11g10000 [Paralvinella palmiformis]
MASLLSNTRHFAKLLSCRGFSTTLSRPLTPGRSMAIKSGNGFKIGQRRYCTNKVELAKKQETSPSKDVKEHSVGVGIADKFHHPSPFEKKLMVWMKVYPSMQAIPKTVSQQSILRAKDMMRVYITYAIVVFSAIVAIIILIMSRRARDQGDSVTKRKLEWKKALEEQGKKERDAEINKSTATAE